MRHSGPLSVLVQLAGLLGTGYIVWQVSVGPRLHYVSAASIVASAFGYALLAWLLSMGWVFALSATVARAGGGGALRIALRASRTAVWLAPAAILLSQLSPAAVIPALALVMGATELLYAEYRAINPVFHPPIDIAADPFQMLPSPGAIRALAPALTAAFGLEGGFLAATTGYPLTAAFFFCATTSMVILLLLSAGLIESGRNTSLPRSIAGVALTVILAAGLTTAHGLLRLNRHLRSFEPGTGTGAVRGPIESTRELVKKLAQPDGGGEDDDNLDTSNPLYTSPVVVDFADNVFPGVILRPEAKPNTTLTVPSPAWTHISLHAMADRPNSIHFEGEYWMFKPPYLRPPRTATIARGTPLTLSYRTTDRRNMVMEARQHLQHPVDLNCCSAIQIALFNADRYPGTISLELILSDSRARPPVPLTLGRALLHAYPKASRSANATAKSVLDTVEFHIPRGAPFRQFNELRIVVHRDAFRADKSARVSIESFILIPRSL